MAQGSLSRSPLCTGGFPAPLCRRGIPSTTTAKRGWSWSGKCRGGGGDALCITWATAAQALVAGLAAALGANLCPGGEPLQACPGKPERRPLWKPLPASLGLRSSAIPCKQTGFPLHRILPLGFVISQSALKVLYEKAVKSKKKTKTKTF